MVSFQILEKQMTSMTSMTSTAGHLHDNAHIQEAYLRERQSLMFLQQLITHSLQVLGMFSHKMSIITIYCQ